MFWGGHTALGGVGNCILVDGVENVWSMLDTRLDDTMPAGFETVPAFKRRVRNAVAWLRNNKAKEMRSCANSMPRRLNKVLDLKGAMTPY